MSPARSYLFTVLVQSKQPTKALAAARITELAAIWGLLDHSLFVRHAGAVADAQPHSAGAGALAQRDLQLSTLPYFLPSCRF